MIGPVPCKRCGTQEAPPAVGLCDRCQSTLTDHALVVARKVGESTGSPLVRATCRCGWGAPCWYASEAHLVDSFARHWPGRAVA